jgi:hypothetical protein
MISTSLLLWLIDQIGSRTSSDALVSSVIFNRYLERVFDSSSNSVLYKYDREAHLEKLTSHHYFLKCDPRQPTTQIRLPRFYEPTKSFLITLDFERALVELFCEAQTLEKTEELKIIIREFSETGYTNGITDLDCQEHFIEYAGDHQVLHFSDISEYSGLQKFIDFVCSEESTERVQYERVESEDLGDEDQQPFLD